MTRRLLAVVLLAGLSLAGCAEDTAAPAGPAASTTASRSVPDVGDPVDAAEFLDDPCGLLSAQEATDLGLPFPEKDGLAGRVACAWREDSGDPAPLEVLRVQILKEYGLAKISAECKVGCDTWVPADISGYPALHANGPLESRFGMCRLYVGITNTRTLMVTDGDLDAMKQGADRGDAGGPKCDRADRAARMVVERLRASR